MTSKRTITQKNSNGYGEIIFNDGGKYIGHLKNGKEHGRGKYIFDKNKIIGTWNKGSLVLRIVYLAKDNLNKKNEYLARNQTIPKMYKLSKKKYKI